MAVPTLFNVVSQRIEAVVGAMRTVSKASITFCVISKDSPLFIIATLDPPIALYRVSSKVQRGRPMKATIPPRDPSDIEKLTSRWVRRSLGDARDACINAPPSCARWRRLKNGAGAGGARPLSASEGSRQCTNCWYQSRARGGSNGHEGKVRSTR